MNFPPLIERVEAIFSHYRCSLHEAECKAHKEALKDAIAAASNVNDLRLILTDIVDLLP